MPTNVAARMTLAADPGSLQGAVAAGILGCGPVHPRHLGGVRAAARGGAAEGGRRRRAGRGGRETSHGAPRLRRQGAGLRPPGAPAARPARRADPRARRRARRERAARRCSRGALRDARRRGLGQAAHDERRRCRSPPCCSTSGFPSATVKAVPILARTAGLLAHLAEEQEQPLGFLMAAGAEEAIEYESGRPEDRSALMLAPEVETRPWAEQLAADDAAYRDPARLPVRALGLLPREAGGAPASRRPRRRAGSPRSRGCRSPRSTSCARRARPDNPVGAHLCATRREIVRIYSTSGTTGTPSYIPLTAGDLDNWVTGSARSYAASGVARRPAASSPPTTPGRSWRARRSPRSTASASATSRSGRGTPSGCCRRSSCLEPEAVVLTPSYAAYLVEWAAERERRPPRVERRARARGGRARRRRAGLPRAGSRRAGARG